MKRASLVAILIAFFGIYAAKAQVILAQQYETKADYAFELRDYNTALSHYTTILKDDPERVDLYWKTAEAARLTHRYAAAERYYEALASKKEANQQPLLDYKLGLVKKSRGKYDEAIVRFQKYLDANATGEMATLATAEIEAAKWASAESKKSLYTVSHLNENVNTGFIDAAPLQIGSILYFSSAYQATLADKPVTHVYATNFQEKALPLSINSKSEGVHTAHYTVTTEGRRLFYTLSTINESGDFESQIWTRSKDADGTWGFAKALDSTINMKGYTTTQPSVGFDKMLNKDVLYFVSNRPGGKGSLDIWYVEVTKDGDVGTPKNLAAVNSAKDDVTPFFLSEQQVLLFSTEGGQSFGGLDIFKTKKNGTAWSVAENLGTPINSSYDDLYPSFSPEAGRYFFVSNREGGMCASKENDCICNDIYMQEIKAKLDASSFYAAGSNVPLNGCRFDLLDSVTGQVINYNINLDGNTFADSLKLNRSYLIVASKKGYLSDTVSFNTRSLYEPVTTVKKELKLRSNIKLEVLVYDKVSRKKLEGSTITISTMDGKILKKTTLTAGNQLWWDELEFGTTYRISATKETYDKDEKSLTTEGYMTMTKTEYRLELYLAPFSGLPLTLYYHNDEPDANSREMTTAKAYGETFLGYYNLQGEYLAASDRISDNDNSNFADSISAFFENQLRGGYEKLQEFSPLLYNYLQNGYGMELVLRGFASPLAETEYNRILTSRRISAVINHFYKYRDGLFRDYITKGQLRIRVEPNGEDKTTYGASDDFKDKKKSIYNLRAMKERRIEIQEVERFEYNVKEPFNLNESLGIYFDYQKLGIATPKKGNAKARLRLANEPTEASLKSKRSKKNKNSNSNGEVGVEYGVAYDTETLTSKGIKKSGTSSAPTKQKYEVVFVDSYTGAVVNGLADVELYDNSERMVGKAVRTKGKKGYTYKVEFDQNYGVKGTVAGYSSESTSHYASITDGGVATDTMYLTPFAGLPLSLYFDNDKPVSVNEVAEETSMTYDQTYRDFISRKGEFIRMYNKMTASAGGSAVSSNEMSLFFGAEVKGGYNRLKGFSTILTNYMQRGYQIEITIEGFASPLANDAYNQKLAARRVDAIVNHFENVNGSILRKYIKNGNLKITVEPMGEVSNQVSDDSKNTSSIYSIEASRERRVVIKDIVILNKF